jgi:hypothetical protein
MKKDEAEKAIRYLCGEWAKELSPQDLEHPSFGAFRSWVEKKGYSHYFDFRSTEGPHRAAEWWFDQEFKQTWRN